MKKLLTASVFFFCSLAAVGQESQAMLQTGTGNLYGTLSVPDTKTLMPVVLIIAGSGPTDRNGNNSYMENNSLKMFADSLRRHGIASLRYDKRAIGQSDRGHERIKDIVFRHFVEDASAWIEQLSQDKRFDRIIVAGHSEGSLVGTLAAQGNKKVAAFISVAGPGRPLDEILRDQLSGLVPEARTVVYGMIDQLKKGDTISNIPPILQPLFGEQIQPFVISLLAYDPADEFSKLDMPCLIISGETDVQVKRVDAEKLAAANPKAAVKIIPGMNHVLKDCDHTDKSRQSKEIYDNPDLPLNKTFVKVVTGFVRSL